MRTRIRGQDVDWWNPATQRGSIFIAVGIFLLAVPQASTRLLALALAIGLILTGGTDLWNAARVRPIPWTTVGLGLLSLFVGVGILALPELAFVRIAQTFAVLLAIRGVMVVLLALRSRRTSDAWTFNLVRGGLSIAAAGVIFVLPDAIETGLLLTIAATALISGAIMISYGLSNADAEHLGAVELGGFIKRWLNQRDVGEEMRLDVIDNLYFEDPDSSQKQVGFWVLLILSTTIATLGILADSTAVVIGAMLVAPLMTPILGVSAGIVNGWMSRVARAFGTVVAGVAVSIFTAWIVALWAPHLVPITSNAQVISRISPTLIDMMIAVAAGAAGAYATVDKRVSSSITGVAIAVALVPPLGVVGVTLTAGAYGDAGGAFLLFLTNLVSIILAASLVFVLTGFALIAKLHENREKMKTVIITVLLGALIVLVPLTFTSEGILTSASRQSTAQTASEKWLENQDGLRLMKVVVKGNEVEITIAGQGDIPPLSSLNELLSDSFGTPTIAIVEYFPSQRLTVENNP
ncbi:MAG: hypothetical protein BMS9Abin12_0655 [Acidimicrobiia bacterium]|nr:MAG: hypothetical protein BMS9Abin12_0655 [Acidimicrobiia bacterium]